VRRCSTRLSPTCGGGEFGESVRAAATDPDMNTASIAAVLPSARR